MYLCYTLCGKGNSCLLISWIVCKPRAMAEQIYHVVINHFN